MEMCHANRLKIGKKKSTRVLLYSSETKYIGYFYWDVLLYYANNS